MRHFLAALIFQFLVGFLPMVYGWGIEPKNLYWIFGGYTLFATLFAIGATTHEERKNG